MSSREPGEPPPQAAAEPGAPTPGIADTLSGLADTLVSAIGTRVQIASIELTEAQERAKRRLVLLLVCAISAGFALFALQALWVAVAWPTWGWRTLALLAVGWCVLAGLAAWRLTTASQREPRPFAATLAELDRDRRWLAERLRRTPR